MANLYQQIIEQKNKQIKALKAKVDDQKKVADTLDATTTVLQKTTLLEENVKIIMGVMVDMQTKDRELTECRSRLLQADKASALKDSENERLK